MGILDDAAIFAAVIQQGGFSHAAKHLGISNGLVSRRISQLEERLGVTLIQRTTRQLKLTPEGEVFWKHAMRMQQEMDAAVSLIQASSKKPRGSIRISAPLNFGRKFLTPIITNFLNNFSDIKIDLHLSNRQLDPVKEQFDLVLRGGGYMGSKQLQDSSMMAKLLLKESIGLYAAKQYLQDYTMPTTPDALGEHLILTHSDIKETKHEKWQYCDDAGRHEVTVQPKFSCNDIESRLLACLEGYGIGRFTQLSVRDELANKKLVPVLPEYNWGEYHLYALYPEQKAMPKRTRLLLDFIIAHTKNIQEKI